MNRINRIFSYILTALLASTLTLAAVVYFAGPLSKLTQVERLILTHFIGDADKKAMEDAASAAMVYALGDQWSVYLSAEEYAAHMEQLENAYVGIGVTITQSPEEKGFPILSVNPKGSAAQAGILPGDIILTAEGAPAAEMTVGELSAVIRGEAGTTVHLEILREDAVLSFDISRNHILTDVVTSQMLNEQIGLITIVNFNSRCSDDAIEAIEALREQGAEALIIDVRNNPGGYVHELVKLLDYLLPEGVLFRSLDYTDAESIERSDADFLDMPMAVICNSESYSAAEFFAAAIQEYQRGAIIGTPTYGKGYFQYTYEFRDGSAVNLSTGKYFTPNGNSLIGVGIQPDILSELTEDETILLLSGSLKPEEDPQLQAAIQALTDGAE